MTDHDAWPDPMGDDELARAAAAIAEAGVDPAIQRRIASCLQAYAAIHPMLPPPDVLRGMAPSLLHAMGDRSGDGAIDPQAWLDAAADHEAQHGPLLLASAPITAAFARELLAQRAVD